MQPSPAVPGLARNPKIVASCAVGCNRAPAGDGTNDGLLKGSMDIVGSQPADKDRPDSAARQPGASAVPAPHDLVGLTVALVLVSILALYWRTTLSMVSIWARSETFAHGFVVIPIFLYLVWRQRRALAATETKPCFPALLGLLATGVIWSIGELVSAISVSQFAMMAMIPFASWAIFGTRVAKTLCIPFLFLFFAVPFGEFLVPTLMNWTADFTVMALRSSGVPVYREGNYFMIPTGIWSIVEACSGLRYLIASLMVGCLYAYLAYRSWLRRAAMVAAAVIVPIVANWLRAYMIVMLGHLSNNRLAVGVDHLIYGWIFFGVVMLLLFWVASRWREDEAVVGATLEPRPVPAPQAHPGTTREHWAAVLAALLLAAIWQPVLDLVDRRETPMQAPILQITGRDGWIAQPIEMSEWRPALSGARAELRQSFAKGEQRVGLYIAVYWNQTPQAKAVTSTNRLVDPGDARWRQVSNSTVKANIAEVPLDVRSAVITGSDGNLAVWQWYWVGNHVTSSDYAAKVYEALSVLQGHGDATAWVVVYTATKDGEAKARGTLQAFAAEMGGSIDAALALAASK